MMTIMNIIATKHSRNTIKRSHQKKQNKNTFCKLTMILEFSFVEHNGKTVAKVARLIKNKPTIRELCNYALAGHERTHTHVHARAHTETHTHTSVTVGLHDPVGPVAV